MHKFKLGIIGTHNSGKTSLCHKIIGQLRSEGYLIDFVKESARNSYYLASGAEYSYIMQFDILARQITEELEILRTAELIVCDRTVIDILAYTQQLNPPQTKLEKVYKKCIEVTIREYVKTYDLLFLKVDYYDTTRSKDNLVKKDNHFQKQIYDCIIDLIAKFKLNVIEVDSDNGLDLIKNKIKKILK